MIGQVSSHGKCSRFRFVTWAIINSQAQAVVRLDKVIVIVFPGCGSPITIDVLGKCQRLPKGHRDDVRTASSRNERRCRQNDIKERIVLNRRILAKIIKLKIEPLNFEWVRPIMSKPRSFTTWIGQRLERIMNSIRSIGHPSSREQRPPEFWEWEFLPRRHLQGNFSTLFR